MTCYDPKQFRQEMMERGLYKEEVVYRTYDEIGFEPCTCGCRDFKLNIYYERDFDDCPWLVDYIVSRCSQCNDGVLGSNMEILAAKWNKLVVYRRKAIEKKAAKEAKSRRKK